MREIGVDDRKFTNMPELKEFCPCAIDIKTCVIESGPRKGERFKIGRIESGKGKGILVFPAWDFFAMKTCRHVYNS